MTDTTATEGTAKPRGHRKVLIGLVKRAKMDKTRRVEVTRVSRHPKYGKYIRHRTVCYVHDENNQSKEGDQVEIMETRPLSKTKRWRLVRVLPASGEAAPAPESEPGAAPAEAAPPTT